MPLTELQIKNSKPQQGKTVRLFDARGLYLEISAAGETWWRLKYRYAGKEKRLSLGVYPEKPFLGSVPSRTPPLDPPAKLGRQRVEISACQSSFTSPNL